MAVTKHRYRPRLHGIASSLFLSDFARRFVSRPPEEKNKTIWGNFFTTLLTNLANRLQLMGMINSRHRLSQHRLLETLQPLLPDLGRPL